MALDAGPRGDRRFFEVPGIGDGFLAVAVDDDGGGSVTVKEGRVDHVTQGEFFDLSGFGDIEPDGKVVGIQVGNDLSARLTLEVANGIGGSELAGWRPRFLFDKINNVSSSTALVVICRNSAPEELESRVSSDTVLGGQTLVLSSVYFADNGSGSFVFQGEGCCSVFWGKVFAVSTPRGVELNKNELVLCDSLIKVVFPKDTTADSSMSSWS